MPLSPGDRVDRYEVIELLGSGGMGEVYRAHDPKLARMVALKVLRASALGDDKGAERLVREARAAAALSHANVVAIYDVGEVSGPEAMRGLAYIAMELVVGRSMRSFVGDPTVPLDRRIGWLRDVARALEAAHQAGIVHRDVKPENVMIRSDGAVKVLDFGIAHTILEEAVISAKAHTLSSIDLTAATLPAQVTATLGARKIAGTLQYMAPETLRGETIDARADQFGWGVMAYYLVTGKGPWRDTDAVGVASQILSEAPPPPPEVDQPLPPGVSDAIVRALSKQREARFGTMAELLEAWETTRQTGRRRAGLVSLALVSVGAVLVLVALVASWRRGPHHDALVGTASAPPRATTLADLPVPATTVTDARTEYMAGMQMMRDDNSVSALHHFERAAQLDPAMTMAHLRIAMLGELSQGGGELVRTEYGKAVALRAGLGQRDAALLNALEPFLGRAAPDEPEGLARLRAVASRFPLDEEIAIQIALRVMGKPGEGSMAARHATELDPSDASAWELLGRNLALEGDIVAGRAALDRCAGISPASADCLNWIAFLDGDAGRCAEMERTARREADRDPKFGNWNLADALVALGRSDVAVREVIARLLDALPPEEASIRKGLFEASLAALQGRFDVTLARLDEADRAIASSPAHRDELDGFAPAAAQRIRTLLEIGDERGARDAAGALVDRLDVARQTSRALGDDGLYLWVRRAAGVPLDPARRDWASAALASATPRVAVWLFAWATPARTRAEAEDALSALGGKDGLELPRGAENMMSVAAGDGPAGNVLLLAGRATEAIPFLRRASANCVLPLEAPFELIHARLELATALARTGDTEGACAVYGELIERLGHATPRSVSAEEARVAAARLRCGRTRDAGGGG